MTNFRRGFTLVEVLMAMGVLALIAAGSLVTAWRLVGIARDYVDETVADAYCHNVIYAADASSNRLNRVTSLQWTINPDRELPRVVVAGLFGQSKTNYPLWRSRNELRRPVCTVAYTNSVLSNLVVTVKWWDMDERERTRSAYATVVPLPGEGE